MLDFPGQEQELSFEELPCEEEVEEDALFGELAALEQDLWTVPESNRADKAMVEAVVTHLDTNGDGYMSKDEIKTLISKLTGFPKIALSDDHPEVLALSDLPAVDLVQNLWTRTPKHTIQRFHDVLFGT